MLRLVKRNCGTDMRLLTKYHKRLRITFLKVSLLALFVSLICLPYLIKIDTSGENTYMIVLNGEACGTVGDRQTADKCLREARKKVACQYESMIFLDAEMELQGSKEYFGQLDEESRVINSMAEILQKNIKETLQLAYTVKVNQTTVNLASATEVETLLNDTLNRYDSQDEYSVKLQLDPGRELTVLVAGVETTRTAMRDEKVSDEQADSMVLDAGIEQKINEILEEPINNPDERSFEDFNYGIVGMGFAENIEVVEAYLPQREISDLATASDLLTKEQEIQQIYTVQKGDTLSGISNKVGIPLDDIIAMNPALVDERTIIHIDQELVITVPEPELSVVWEEECYYEESYEAPVIYVDNDDWYTTEKVTLQEPVAGYRRVVAIVKHVNDNVTETDIIKEEVVVEAVAKIVERGTKIPPTYIKPLSGGSITSNFGKRNISLKGASTYHEGVDWGTPIGTKVWASCGGTVTRAGWGSGYGYVIYIKHADGRETRYAHLSKIYVKVGEYVSQGQKIALSGNSGRSSGPHLHFEMRINGKAVNPLNYLN